VARHPSFNCTLGWDSAGGTGYDTIGQVKDISGPSISRDTIEVTDRDVTSNYKEFWGGYADGGDITFTVNWDPINSRTHGTAAGTGLLTNFEETDYCDTKAAWQLQLDLCGGTATWTFDGITTGFDVGMPENGVLTADVSVKVSGKPTLTIS